jgi:hypothetical protein
MRREELCDAGLCPDAPDDAGRCDHDVAQVSQKGLLIRRAFDLMCALNLGVRISLDEIRADELAGMLIIAEERDTLEREKSPPCRGRDPT